MKPEEKVALLKEAGVWDVIGYPTCIDKLFDLVAAHEREKLKTPRMTLDEIKKLGGHRQMAPWVVSVVIEAMAIEREACAKVCEELGNEYALELDRNNCAAAIRNRSNT